MPTHVRYQVDRGAATITLDSPANRNALSAPLVGQVRAKLAEAAADPAVRVVVLTGTGSTFCSGADLRDPPDPGEVVHMYADLWQCTKPVVAVANGSARAGGLGLLAASDIAVGPVHASFAFSEVRIGVAPAIIAVLCLRCMSPRATSRYLLTGEVFAGDVAAEIGLLTAAIAEDDVEAYVAGILDALRQAEPSAVATTKALLRRLPEQTVGAGLADAAVISAELFASAAAAEGMLAFREKRLPSWAIAPGPAPTH